MRRLFPGLLLLFAQTATAQVERPAPKLPFSQSISAAISYPMVIGEKENGQEGAFNFFPSYHLALSVNLYKGFSVKGGLWRAAYLASRIPEDYNEHLIVSFGPSNKVHDIASGTYGLLAYDYYLPLTRRASDIKVGLQFQPAVGIGKTQLREAHFTVHVPSGGFSFFAERTHDYQHMETTALGLAAQLGIYGYVAVNPKFLFYIGSNLLTLPGETKRIYGADIGWGISVALRR